VAEAAAYAGELVVRRAVLAGLVERATGVEAVGSPAASFLLLRTARARLWEPLRELGFAVRRGDTFPGLGPNWVRVAVRDEKTSVAFAAALEECG
jgi:histidinol-phosphate aminotransferase